MSFPIRRRRRLTTWSKSMKFKKVLKLTTWSLWKAIWRGRIHYSSITTKCFKTFKMITKTMFSQVVTSMKSLMTKWMLLKKEMLLNSDTLKGHSTLDSSSLHSKFRNPVMTFTAVQPFSWQSWLYLCSFFMGICLLTKISTSKQIMVFSKETWWCACW